MDLRKTDFLTGSVSAALICLLAGVNAPGQELTYPCRSVSPPPSIDGEIAETAWTGSQWLTLRENSQGGNPVQSGRVAALWDQEFLYIAFDFQDNNILSTITTRDDRLWVQDVAEVFIAPSGNDRLYYEFQFSPLSNWRDALVIHHGVKSEFKVLQEWNVEARVKAQARGTLENNQDDDIGWTAEIAIPFADLWLADNRPPVHGERWKMNFYRIDYGGEKPELSAWCPTLKPTFHDPPSFGTVEFR